MNTMTEEQRQDILKMNELDTYFLIDECGAFMWRMSHDMAHNRIPSESHAAIQEDINGVRVVQKFAADNLTRFGIDPESVNDKENGDYWKWYRFWDNWKKDMSDEVWEKVNALIKKKEPLDEYLPVGNWNDQNDFVI